MAKKKVPNWSSPVDMGELHRLATEQQRLFRNLVQFKTEYDIELNDLFIFLGLGLLNYERSNAGPVPVQPVGISSVSEFLAMPKETVRRKLSRLEKKGLVTKTAYGFLVKETEVWKSLAQTMNA
jgi:DNA-binding MarR family transcriptional regulator